MAFGKRLRLLRNEKNLTLRELEEQTGITYSALGKYERDERQPDFDTLEKLADYFDVSIDWLLGRTDLRTYEERVFSDDVNYLAEKLTTLEPEKRKLIVNTIDQLYLIIHGSLDDEKSLIILKDIISQLFFIKNGIEDFKFENLLEIESPISVLEFMSKHKNEMNNLLDEYLKVNLGKIAERKSKFTPPSNDND